MRNFDYSLQLKFRINFEESLWKMFYTSIERKI